MNKFAKALLLALVVAAPVIMSAHTVQAKPATAPNRVALKSKPSINPHHKAKHATKQAAHKTTHTMAARKK